MPALPVQQDRIVVIFVVDGVAMFGSGEGVQIYLRHTPTLSPVRHQLLW
jgi:hypothetical protein